MSNQNALRDGSSSSASLFKYFLRFCALYLCISMGVGIFEHVFSQDRPIIPPIILVIVSVIFVNGLFRDRYGRGFNDSEYLKIVCWSILYDMIISLIIIIHTFGNATFHYPIFFNFSITMLLHVFSIAFGYSSFASKSFLVNIFK